MPAAQNTKTSTKPAAKSAAKPATQAVAKPAAKQSAAAKPAAKAAAKPAVKPVATKAATPAAKPAAKAPAKTTAQAPKATKAAKADGAGKEKVKKPKLVRDSFTMPEAEYEVLGELKKACLKAGFDVKKSELLRIGVAMMRKADVAQLKTTLAGLPPLKAGRPKKTK